MLTQAIALGLVIGFFFEEITGFLVGGLVVPGYLAVFWDQPLRIAITFGVALITDLIIRFLSRYILLYGRRRFVCTIITGFLGGWLVMQNSAWTLSPVFHREIAVIGYIIPGLIANVSARQGMIKTYGSTLLIAALVKLLLVFIWS